MLPTVRRFSDRSDYERSISLSSAKIFHEAVVGGFKPAVREKPRIPPMGTDEIE